MNQKGFFPILIVAILAAAIIAGTYLVQSGINFLPNAAEQEALNPSAGKTKNCTEATDKDQCQKENDVICAKDTVTYCDNRSGSPRAIRKSGGYYEAGNANADPASGCVFDYREVEGKNTECGKSESKSGDVVYTTKEEAQKLDSDREKSRPEREKQAGLSSGGAADASCPNPDATTTAFKDEKVTGNLVRYYAILAGQPEYCVPADLGVLPKKEAQNSGGQTGRLMLCSKTDSSLTWRVIISGSKLEATTKADPTKEEAESEMKQNLEEALKVASPTQTAPAAQPADPTPAEPATTDTRLISSLSIELDPDKETCGIEGTTCKLFTNSQKNDGIIFYTGKTDVIFTLIAPNANQEPITVQMVPGKEIKSAAGLESFLTGIQEKIDWREFAAKWNSYGGKILLPKSYRP